MVGFLIKHDDLYFQNLQQNKNTFLPKFYGLFCYQVCNLSTNNRLIQSLGKNIRLLVMNNLLPQTVTMHEKYDIKGSTYKRVASKAERAKVFFNISYNYYVNLGTSYFERS